MRSTARSALAAVCFAFLLASPGDAAPDPEDIAAEVTAARKELNLKGSSTAYFEQNAQKRVTAWKAAAEKGSAGAQWLYGRCLDIGVGTDQDEKEAVKWYRKSAEQGFALGENSLGQCLRSGEGGAENPKEAVKWMRKAADQNEPAALCNLAEMHEDGTGVKVDRAEAIRLFQKASAAGFVEATLRLVVAFEDGDGAEKNPDEAKKMRERAREQIGAGADKRLRSYAFRRQPVGRPAPDVSAAVDGKLVKLADCRGKVVVVAFMANWCKYCREEIPHHEALVKRLKGQPFVLLTVDGDKNPSALAEWGVSSYPTVYVIDAKGVVRNVGERGKGVGQEVDKLIKDVPSPKK
ncbi:MAG TPA: redoxin domain-containing protein [Gemmata sp.]